MQRILPSTMALRVFEAAARHLTFTGAADELFLTQSAVSKQIRTLEEALGVALFVRLNRGLVLTELGRVYLQEIGPPLQQLAAASTKLATRSTLPTTLTLRILAAVGDRWLLPRFGLFSRAHPDIEVQFTSLLSRDGQAREIDEPDGEFRYGEGSWPGFVVDYLFGHEMLLVAAPALLTSIPVNQKSDLFKHVLLDHFQVPEAWPEFCATHSLPAPLSARHTRYEFYSTLLQSAVAGMGIALVPSIFVKEEILRGELINPLALGFKRRRGYFFVVPEHKQYQPSLALFRAWLQGQADVVLPSDDQSHATDVPADRVVESGMSTT